MTTAPVALESALAEAVAKAAGLRAEKAARTARKHWHENEAVKATERAASIRSALDERNAERARDGAPLDGKAEADAAEAERSAAAHEGATRLIGAEIAGLATEESVGRLALTTATLDCTTAARDKAKAGALTVVSGLIETLAALLASDDVRTALIGERYTFDPNRHPPASLWSGRHLAFAIIDGLPARVTPDGFRDEVIALADRIARETLERMGVAQ